MLKIKIVRISLNIHGRSYRSNYTYHILRWSILRQCLWSRVPCKITITFAWRGESDSWTNAIICNARYARNDVTKVYRVISALFSTILFHILSRHCVARVDSISSALHSIVLYFIARSLYTPVSYLLYISNYLESFHFFMAIQRSSLKPIWKRITFYNDIIRTYYTENYYTKIIERYLTS